MARFDQTIWKARATRRFQQALALGKPTAGAMLLRDIASIESLETVVGWCEAKKLGVSFGKKSNGAYEACERSITINGRMLPELQLHILLHECGHHLVGTRALHQRFGVGYSADDVPGVNKTSHHRVDVLDEEFEAWYRGFKLAKRLKILLDEKSWHRNRTQVLKSYMKWVLKVDGYGGSDEEEGS